MQAVILAAGQGRRLADPRGRPKCLRKVGGAPLVRHQLDALASVGIDDVVIVVGFGQDQVRQSVGSKVRYVVNHWYAETNSMYSFLLARGRLSDDVLVLNSDVYCHPGMLDLLLAADGDALLYDSGSGDDDEQMKVQARDGILVSLSKTLPPGRVSGENVGLLRLSRDTAEATAAAAADLIAEGRERAWLAEAVNVVAKRRPIECIDVRGWPWIEIDFPEDLVRARREVFPRVVSDRAPLEADSGDGAEPVRRIS